MKIIIPAAGEGVRLRPHTLTQPKPLLRIAGKTVIDFVLEPLLDLNPSELVMVVGYRGDQLRDYVQTQYDLPVTCVEQDQLLGLGYAVSLGLDAAGSDEDVLIILADTVIQADFGKFIQAGENVLALKSVDDPRRFGVAEIESGKIARLVEKPSEPKSNLAVVGLYYFKDPKPLAIALKDLIKSGKRTAGEIQLTDALALMLDRGVPFVPYEITGWLDCGKRETMLSTNAALIAESPRKPKSADGSGVADPVWVDASAHIEDSTIGPNVTVYHSTRIVNSTVENCIIGPETRIENCNIRDSLIGERVTLRDKTGEFDIGDDGVTENK